MIVGDNAPHEPYRYALKVYAPPDRLKLALTLPAPHRTTGPGDVCKTTQCPERAKCRGKRTILIHPVDRVREDMPDGLGCAWGNP